MYVFMYIRMYICILMLHHFWFYMECQMSNTVKPQYVDWLLLHFLIHQSSVMPLPPGPASSVNELCTREHEARHSKTLADFAVPDNTGAPSDLDLFDCWHCRHDSDGCQMSWNVPAEYTLQHRHHIHGLTLSTLALFEFDGEKITNYKSSDVPDSIFIRLNE